MVVCACRPLARGWQARSKRAPTSSCTRSPHISVRASCEHDGRSRSHEAFETLFSGLADRAYQRRLRPGTQVPAHPASPDGEWQPAHIKSFHAPCVSGWTADRPSIRDRRSLLRPVCNLSRNVERAVARAIVVQIGITIVAGTNQIQILFGDS